LNLGRGALTAGVAVLDGQGIYQQGLVAILRPGEVRPEVVAAVAAASGVEVDIGRDADGGLKVHAKLNLRDLGLVAFANGGEDAEPPVILVGADVGGLLVVGDAHLHALCSKFSLSLPSTPNAEDFAVLVTVLKSVGAPITFLEIIRTYPPLSPFLRHSGKSACGSKPLRLTSGG
jgi:hypothetical protein